MRWTALAAWMANPILFSGSTMISDLESERRIAGYTEFSGHERAMAKPEKMTEEELISLIDQHLSDSLGYIDDWNDLVTIPEVSRK